MKKFFASMLLSILVSCLVPNISFAIDFDMDDICESVVVVHSANSVGSGFAISKDKIVTNHHVVDTTTQYTIETKNGGLYHGRLLAFDEAKDLSLIEVLGGNLPTIPMTEDVPPLGTDVFAVGSPQGMGFTVSRGVLSTIDRQLNGVHYIQTDAAINPGNSGGPLLNEKGQVIGVNNMKVADADRISLAIPMSSVVTFLQKNDISVQLSDSADVELESPDSVVIQSSAMTGGVQQSYEQYSNSLRNQYTTILNTIQKENKILVLGLIVIGVICIIFIIVMLSQKEKLKLAEQNLNKAIDALKKQGAQINVLQRMRADGARRVHTQTTDVQRKTDSGYQSVKQNGTAFVSGLPRRTASNEKQKVKRV